MSQMTRLLIIALLLLLPLEAIAANTLQGIRVWAAPESTRIVLDLSAKAKYQHSTLVKPNRLVVDLVGTKLKFDLKKIKNSSKLLKRVRLSKPPKKGTTRIVLDLNQPVKSKLFLLSPT
ncbi:MAG: AMIN domain-containing protein, partial [Shewanella sp.]|nr:AMIN domain-containing protein [Shewanella sp.]